MHTPLDTPRPQMMGDHIDKLLKQCGRYGRLTGLLGLILLLTVGWYVVAHYDRLPLPGSSTWSVVLFFLGLHASIILVLVAMLFGIHLYYYLASMRMGYRLATSSQAWVTSLRPFFMALALSAVVCLLSVIYFVILFIFGIGLSI